MRRKVLVVILSVICLLIIFTIGFIIFLLATNRDVTWNSWRIIVNQNYDRQNLFGEPVYVYETEVDDDSACTSVEQYDEDRHVCAYQCNDVQDCEQKKKWVEDELATFTSTPEKDKKNSEKNLSTGHSALQAEYKVNPDGTLTLLRGNDAVDYQEVWDQVHALVPKEILQNYLDSFQVFADKNEETIAFTNTADDNDSLWKFGVNIPIFNLEDEKEKKVTLIHELGHIITLNNKQIAQIKKEECKTYYSDDGCSGENSYLNLFVKQFWHVKEEPKDNNTEDADEASFVDAYAATNPEEDLAETFAYFVVQPKATGTLIKDQKLNFFYQFPELVKMREQMRAQLARSILN
jgi:hypothetical protein